MSAEFPWPTAEAMQRLELRPGDILVLKLERYLPATAREHLKTYLSQVLPGQKVLILEGGADLCVLTREQIAELESPT